MSTDQAIVAVAKVGLVFVAAATVAPSFNSLSVPLIGVPLSALAMAGVGAAFSFAWSPGHSSRGKLFFVAAASTVVGAACVSVIPHLLHLDWPVELQPPLAFLFGLLAPWVVPAMRGAIPALFKGLANLIVRMVGQKIDSTGDTDYEPREYTPHNRDD